jgi:NAD(P)-dependent dehydrogenase (short-subunit alcohol dehydrogenase family)
MFDVTGKRVVVTGAAQGLGSMVADGFAAAGASVVVTGRDKETLDAQRHEYIVGDVATEAGSRALAESIGEVDVLVNNAGIGSVAPFESFDEEAWESVLAVNLKGTSHLTRFLLPALRNASHDGDPARVINIGSIAGARVGNMDNFAYTSSKAALHHFTKHLARRLAPAITVNAISPGPFPSRLTRDVLEGVAKTVPLGRVGATTDIAGAAIYLASAAGAWVTGTVLTVDGGLSLT